jgi:hypothetical protein
VAKPLGETFGEETLAAGLGGLPFAWGATDETITGRENLTTEQNATLDGVIAAHDPSKKLKNIVDTSTFVTRWTNAEYLALSKGRTADNGHLAKTWDIVFAEPTVDLNKSKAQNLKTTLVADGILTAARANEIFDTPMEAV